MSKIKAGSKRDLLSRVDKTKCTCRSCGGSKSYLKWRIHKALRKSDKLAIAEEF